MCVWIFCQQKGSCFIIRVSVSVLEKRVVFLLLIQDVNWAGYLLGSFAFSLIGNRISLISVPKSLYTSVPVHFRPLDPIKIFKN